MKSSILESTLQYDLCIGCGICAAVCPTHAISMQKNEELYFAPVIDDSKCVDCGKCSALCTNSREALAALSRSVAAEEDPHMWGLRSASGYLMCSSEEGVKESASGGIATLLAKELLTRGMIDAVLHAESLTASHGDIHFAGVLSTTEEEIERRRGSIYAPINFDSALDRIKENDAIKRILVMGTPCVTRATRRLFTEDKRFGIEQVYTCSLACSHNVNGMFASYMADTFGIARDATWSINYRDKEGAPNATNFNTALFDAGGKAIARENRFQSQFTPMWRGYAFSMNCCNSCSDFWGGDSDISVKDAWGKWSHDKDAKSIVVFRNQELAALVNALDIFSEPLSVAELVACQRETVAFKQEAAAKRVAKDDPAAWNKIDGTHKRHAKISAMSKREYKYMLENGYTDKILKKVKHAHFVERNNPVALLKRLKKKIGF